MWTFASFLVLCFLFAVGGLIATYGWRLLIAYSVPAASICGIPALVYLYEHYPEAFIGGLNKPFTVLVYSILTAAIIGACILMRNSGVSQKQRQAAAVRKYRDLDGFYGGDDAHFMNAVAICSMPHNAINPLTGKRYTSAEHADPVQVAAWFHEPNKMVYDYDLNMNVPYKK